MVQVKINYQINQPITVEQYIALLSVTTLGARRPLEDNNCLTGMLANSNLLITAWHKERLVGLARSVTDFHYCCYLSDLAVAETYQHQGIGKQLIEITHQQLGEKCKLVLLAAPQAVNYYPHIGFSQHPSAWVLASQQQRNNSS